MYIPEDLFPKNSHLIELWLQTNNDKIPSSVSSTNFGVEKYAQINNIGNQKIGSRKSTIPAMNKEITLKDLTKIG